MQVLIVAFFAFIIGLAILLYGYRIFLVLLPIWGFFAGFWFGADVIALIFGQGFLATTTGWMVGFFLGLVFALFSYLYFSAAVAVIAAVIGFSLGSGFMSAIGMGGGFFAGLAGIVVAVLFFAFAIARNIKAYLIMFLTAIIGANALITALLLVIGKVTLQSLQQAGDSISLILQDSWIWLLLWLFLAGAGLLFQLRSSRAFKFERDDYREVWG